MNFANVNKKLIKKQSSLNKTIFSKLSNDNKNKEKKVIQNLKKKEYILNLIEKTKPKTNINANNLNHD